MSIYSGKCDVADYVEGLAGWYDNKGNRVKFNDKNYHGPLFGHEMEDFEEFKKQTGGVLYQEKLIKLTESNQAFVQEQSYHFNVIEHKHKTLFRKKEYSTYSYELYGRKYKSLEKINKIYGGVYITTTIPFETLLDLIPYYPYLVSAACKSDSKLTLYLSSKSYVDTRLDEVLQSGRDNGYLYSYKHKLVEHMKDVALKYYSK